MRGSAWPPQGSGGRSQLYKDQRVGGCCRQWGHSGERGGDGGLVVVRHEAGEAGRG